MNEKEFDKWFKENPAGKYYAKTYMIKEKNTYFTAWRILLKETPDLDVQRLQFSMAFTHAYNELKKEGVI